MSKKEIEAWISELTPSKVNRETYNKIKRELTKELDLRLDDNHIKIALLAGIHASKKVQDPVTFHMTDEPIWNVRKDYLTLALKFLGKLNPEQDALAGVLIRPLPIKKKLIK